MAYERHPLPDADPAETAATWFARMRSGDMDAAERQRFAAWRTDPANAKEYAALERIWNAAGAVSPERVLGGSPNERRRSAERARWLNWNRAGLALCCVLAIGLYVGITQWERAQPVFTAGLESARGELKTFTLPDGSIVDANTQTSVSMAYFRDRREARLQAGEATFSVERDADRPFLVIAGKASIRVTGTRFNVRRRGDEVAVTVLAGTVEVSGLATPSDAAARLTPDQAIQIDGEGKLGQIQTVIDTGALVAWREGRLVFDDTPLAEVLREVGRYRARPITLARPDLGELRVSGTFRVNDTEALLAALPRILPVRVRSRTDGSAEIY